jgi:hypothetical protein
MKKMKIFVPALICIIFTSMGCNDAGSEKSTTPKESTSPGDTIKSDESKFSEPH